MKKILKTYLMVIMFVLAFTVTYQVNSKPIEVQAHYAVPHVYPGYLIKYNPTWYDENAKIIQYCLNVHNSDEHYYNVGVVDGYFGTKTLEMVKKFQADHGLSVDGVVGKLTWNAIVYETLCP